ncbi:hypothetical protein K8R42_05250 [bacterium]|nr:hypothetical protein [bacterium]
MTVAAREVRPMKPYRGPTLTSFKKGILESLYNDLKRLPKGSTGSVQGSINFILRKNCRCPKDSQYCICGGGFSVGSVKTAM